MCCVLGYLVASATRRLGANSVVAFRSASSGGRETARCASIQMNRFASRSVWCLLALPNSDRYAASGFGSAAKVCPFLCKATMAASVGSTRPILPSIMCSLPVYASAYVYGKSRHEIILDASGARKKRVRKLPREQWSVLIPNHHEGYIDWNTYEANLARIGANTRPRPHQSGGGAVREGSALLQGLAVCGRCGRKLRTHYTGRTASAGYHCAGT